MSKSQEYVNVSTAARQIAAGAMLAPGQSSDLVDAKNPHDKALIDEGHLVPREGKEES